MIVDLGQLSAIGCTKWQSDKEYKKGQMVIDVSDLYTALVANRGHKPSEESSRTYWEKNTNLKELMDRAQETVDAAEGVNRAIEEANTARDEAKDAAQYAIEYIDGDAKSKIDDAEAATVSANNAANTALAEAQKANDATVNANQAAANGNTQYNTLKNYHDNVTTPDHTRAEQDHNRANADHYTAASDHSTANTDHTNVTTNWRNEFTDAQAARAAEFNRTQQEKQAEFARTEKARQDEFDSKEAVRDAANAEAVTFADNMADVNRDMGKYQQLPDVTLTLVESGKRIDKDGKFVADSSWNIGRLGAVSKGNIYELLMGGSDKMVLGTSLFVSHTVERIGGQDKDVYKHLYSAATSDLPVSNYAVMLAGEDYSDVLVSYRNDVAGANTMKVARWGIFASIATQLANLRGDVDLKSFSDGYYDNMGVGFAKNLIGDGEATHEEFTERVAGGTHQIDDSLAEYVTIKGNSVVKNQKCINSDERKTISASQWNSVSYDVVGLLSGHKYLLIVSVDGNIGDKLFVSSSSEYEYMGYKTTTSNKVILTEIGTQENVPSDSFYVMRYAASESTTNVEFLRYIDLTQWYNGNVPEGLTAEDFIKMNPDVLTMPYTEPHIVNMTADGVKTTGRNLWDEELENGKYIDVNTGEYADYSGRRASSRFIEIKTNRNLYVGRFVDNILAIANYQQNIYFYDKNKNFISVNTNGGEVFVPSDAVYFRVASAGTVGDICINISDPSINGQYEPHITSERKWTETMKKCFPDGMAKAGTAYDEMTSSKAVKRIGKAEFDGTEHWIYEEDAFASGWAFRCVDYVDINRTYNVISAGYKTRGYWHTEDKTVGVFMTFQDFDYTTLSAWKQHLADLKAAGNPLTAYYELAEPIVTTYDELNLTSRVWRNGMEEIIVPEGKESSPISADVIYQINAFKTIKANKKGIEDLNAKPAISLTAEEVAKLRALIANTQSLSEE